MVDRQVALTMSLWTYHSFHSISNGQEFSVTHVGNGELSTSSHNFVLQNIHIVPDLASNILSVHKLCLQNNAFFYFDSNQFSIVDLPSRRVLYRGLSKDVVYPIPLPSQSSSTASLPAFNSAENVAVSSQAMLWRQRLGHPCSKLLNPALSTLNKPVQFSVHTDICSQCKSCISAKMHKFSFPNTK